MPKRGVEHNYYDDKLTVARGLKSSFDRDLIDATMCFFY
jgi:hypothetical protein